MTTVRAASVALASIALAWAIGNTLYVYLVLGGERLYRVETAAYWLAAALVPLLFLPRARPAGVEQGSATWSRVIVVTAAAAWLVSLAPFVSLPFLSDDYVFLASYRQPSDIFGPQQFFRPMFGAVFLLLAGLGDGSVLPFHAAAFALHATGASLVYVLAHRLFRSGDAAALCFVLFLLNPLQLEAVLWVSGLQELLWSTFALAALVAYTGSTVISPGRLAVTLLLLAGALLSKETALSTAVLVPLADWAFFGGTRRGRLQPVAYAAVLAACGGYLLLRGHFAGLDPSFYAPPSRYFVQKFVATPYRFFAQPWNAAAADLPSAVPGLATVLSLALLFAAVVRGTGPLVLFGPVLILLSTLPIYRYFFVAPDLRASRYLYFAAAGWAFLAAHLVRSSFRRPRAVVVAGAVVLAISFLCLHVNLRPWRAAGSIVGTVASDIEAGRSPDRTARELRLRWGEGLEFKGDVPQTYQGVYLFVNGLPELRAMLTEARPRRQQGPASR
jgi:hypothetical protein